ncbi:FtsX-like permease family protein [uncultured Eubacterium sp.]|uniref:FtsX-like permease family protein n=1 Tax=uncultured Eubacterium sp. TaxID=165185 RepID=UPI002805EA63|nr:FtsX-like permease family protein [uncultured Eubacterium sp.]
MHNPLNKRFKRDLRSDAGKYVAIFLFIVFFIGAASGFMVADNSVFAQFKTADVEYNVEDGHLAFNVKPSTDVLSKIESQNDLKLYDLNYKEETIKHGKTLRIYKVRNELNKECLMSGEMPKAENEIAVDRMFAENNKIAVGDNVNINSKNYIVSGLIALSDYSALFKSNGDMMFDAVGFGVAVMTNDGYNTIETAHETVNYAWKYNSPVEDEETENAKSELLMKSLEKILKEYDEPLIQAQVDSLYDDAKPYINRLKAEFESAEKQLESKYLSAIVHTNANDTAKMAKELGITEKQYKNLKQVLEDAEKDSDKWDFDSLDSAPKINLDDYKTSSDMDFDEMYEEIYKVVDAVSGAGLYDCSQIYRDLASLKKITDKFSIDDSGVLNITDYSAKYTNKSIMYAREDSTSDKATMMLMTYIVMVMIAFLFAVTTSNTISKEANVIGTLRAMGYSKGELIGHYIFLPMVVTVVAGIVGNVLGYTAFQKVFESVYYSNYSFPTYKMLWNMNAFLETTVVPFVLMLLVNFVMLSKKLKISPLNFIRGELKESGQKRLIKLPKEMPFFSKFRLRILFQNVPSYLTLALGVFLAGTLVVFGSMYGPLLDDYANIVKENQISKYQYVMINEAETKVSDAEKFCMTSLQTTDKKFIADDVTIYGVENQSKYIKENIPAGEVLVSSAMADKFNLSIGDEVTLKEAYKEKNYSFKVGGIYNYDAAITVFINRTDYIEQFNEDSNYFNGYFSNKKLNDLDDADVATVITEKDLTKVVTQMQVSMTEFVKVFKALGVVIFLLVMFILTKQIIEKNSKSVSMAKILGFSDSEIGKLYIVITSFVVVASLLVSVPLISLALRWCFKSYLYTQMTGYIPYIVSNSCYVTMVVLGIVSYAVVACLMLLKIKKTPLGEALKNQSF